MLKLLKVFWYGAMAASFTFAAYELKQVSHLAQELKSGAIATPDALKALPGVNAGAATGPLTKLLAEQQIQGLDGLGAEAPAPANPAVAPAAPAPPAADLKPVKHGEAYDTNSARAQVKVTRAGGAARASSGGAVLIDAKTGQRFEIAGHPPESPKPLARLGGLRLPNFDVDLAGSGDLRSRKRRAYAILLLSAIAAFVSVVYVRRSIVG